MCGRGRTTCPGQGCCANLRSVAGLSKALGGLQFWSNEGATSGGVIWGPFSFVPPPLLLDISFYIHVYTSHQRTKST
jgi:hypothetical protein